jgi:hypothetical protein
MINIFSPLFLHPLHFALASPLGGRGLEEEEAEKPREEKGMLHKEGKGRERLHLLQQEIVVISLLK